MEGSTYLSNSDTTRRKKHVRDTFLYTFVLKYFAKNDHFQE